MHDAQLQAALHRLVPEPPGEHAGWRDVQRRARRLRVKQRSLLAVAALGIALFSTLAAGGQIGTFASHSRAPHLLIRGTLETQQGMDAGSVELELERAIVAFGWRVRVMRWQLPADDTFRARWFLNLDAPLETGALVIGGTRQPVCGPCGVRASGELELSPHQAAALVNDEATFVGEGVSGPLALDRSHLQRGVRCAHGSNLCTRIYTGRP
jgi:hypothetical protein